MAQTQRNAPIAPPGATTDDKKKSRSDDDVNNDGVVDIGETVHADDDENAYVDQHGLWRWRVCSPDGAVIVSADHGEPTKEAALKARKEAEKDGQLEALRKFQPDNAPSGEATTTENIHRHPGEDETDHLGNRSFPN